MYIEVDFNELNLIEEVDFLPLVFQDFSPSDQNLMFKLIHDLELKTGQKLMERFKQIYEFNYNERFVQPTYNPEPIYNVSEDLTENLNISDSFPMSSQVVNISLHRGSKDSCEPFSEAPVMIIDRVHFRKGRPSVDIGYDENDEGAPIMGRKEWRRILQHQDESMETPAPNSEARTEIVPKQGLSDRQNITNAVERQEKSPIRVKRNKDTKVIPYNLRNRTSSQKGSVDKDAQMLDVVKASGECSTSQAMDVESIETLREFDSKFVRKQKIAAKRSQSSIILASGAQYIEISRTTNRNAYYNDGFISIYNHCENKVTALTLLRGYITNRHEVNGLWEQPATLSSQPSILNENEELAIQEDEDD